MKDELASKEAKEFVGLKPKMCSLTYENCEKKTAKGVPTCIIRRQHRHNDYKNCLLKLQRSLGEAQRIASTNHKVQTLYFRKSTLCPFDSKRYILEDGVQTLAYGHYKISR
ncbi:hypothetical protein AVEN_250247-1 [Araneus ventricosus]|uniref:Uncharacterized protein n=1 Tax=Araneus ventricosus TaxID=182803 RepID=A0A4Y2FHS9_ARAVE|nr:hypothetical protein AVEN_250247-1 [Araneus ventricosus]